MQIANVSIYIINIFMIHYKYFYLSDVNYYVFEIIIFYKSYKSTKLSG